MDDLLKSFDSKIKTLLDSLRLELSGFRANRPSPQLIEDIQVDYLGQMLKVKQLGSISVSPPRGLVITVWDKNSAPLIAKSLENSSLKLNPSFDGNVVRVNLPELTAERREELIKVIKKSTENFRIKFRAMRDEVNREIERSFKAKEINEDEKFKSKNKVQEAVNRANKEIENLLESKVKEISE